MTDRPLLVILRALGMGDLLTVVPALRALADAFPDHRRVLMGPTELAPLAMLTGTLHAVFPAAPLALWQPDGSHPALAVNLQSNSAQSYAILLATHPRRLVGFANPALAETAGFPEVDAGEHEVWRWCRLLVESGISADPSRLDLPPPEVSVPAELHGVTLLHPGASHPIRRWPPERWAAVARALGGRVIITGSPAERPNALLIAEQAQLDPSAVLAGTTDVLELAAVVAAAARVISGDTGVAHLATALRRPSVILFSDQHPPSRWGPPADRPIHRVIWSVELSRDEPGIRAIAVDDVLAALERLAEA